MAWAIFGFPPLFALGGQLGIGDRVAFALKADLPVFLWLAGCVRAVSKGRFLSQADIQGSAFSRPSPAIELRVAVLQNSLEQTVLAAGAHLILATVLYGAELRLIPILVSLYLFGRITFAIGYAQHPTARAFGMAMTGVSTVVAYTLAVALILSGR